MTQNSTLSQNRVECTVCTPWTLAARTAPKPHARRALSALSWCTGRRIVAPSGHVATRTDRVARCAARRVVSSRSRYKNCIATQIPAAHVACHVATQRPPLRHDTKFCITTHSSGQAFRARAAACPTHCLSPPAQADLVVALLVVS